MTINDQNLKRELKLADAVWLGLGSILGTGVFVSIGIAAGITGPAVILAVALAAFVATFNALSSAQLAAAHSVSGGTYEYGYKYLGATWGFTAGWMFLLAKSASAATAALGLAGYVNTALGIGASPVLLAFLVVLGLTGIVLMGARRTSRVNTLIVSITLAALTVFIGAAALHWLRTGNGGATGTFFKGHGPVEASLNFFEATALMFVAYTGYGRVATLAEEVANPKRVIPRAIVTTLIVSATVYMAVALTGIGTVGADFLHKSTSDNAAPLTLAARVYNYPYVSGLVAIGAATAMLSVLLNLILGLSRVTLAMGRRGDMPKAMARLNKSQHTPPVSVLVVGLVIASLTLVGSVKTTWSFSALTVLIYYAITNAAALAVPVEERIFPKWISWAGLASCLFLTAFIDGTVWVYGIILVAGGFALRAVKALFTR